MNVASITRQAAGLAILMFLAACSSMPASNVESASREILYESRLHELSELKQWKIEGRLAVNDGKDGGSGNFKWSSKGESNSMNFHGALGRGAWRLEADKDGAVLELADGETYQAPSVSELLEQNLGWKVPVDALAWWVRGLAAPGTSASRELNKNGQLVGLDQLGWMIKYGRYRDNDGVFMPIKMTASKDSQTLKLVVRGWNLAPGKG